VKIDFVDFTGDCYGEAWPGGPWLTSASGFYNLLHFRVSEDARVVGQAAVGGHGLYIIPGLPPIDLGPSAGINVGAFHPTNGEVYLSTFDGVRIFNRAGEFRELRAGYIGSLGIRNVRPNGSIITGDETESVHLGLNEYTDLGDGCLIGQGNEGGVRCWIDGGLREIVGGAAFFVRVNRVNDDLAICFPVGHRNCRVLTTMGELRRLPLVATATVPPPLPSPPIEVPMPVAPVKFDVVKRVIADHPEINRLEEGTRGRITELVVIALGGRPWGRKDRDQNPDNNNNSDDALCYLLPDGSFEIYDILSGADGSGQWDFKGTFKDGENGFFREVRVAPDGGNHGGTDSPEPAGGLDEDAVNKLIGQAIGKAIGPLRDRLSELQQIEDSINARLSELGKAVEEIINRPARTVRTTANGFGPLKHSHEVTF
jgi:hypothetical protein